MRLISVEVRHWRLGVVSFLMKRIGDIRIWTFSEFSCAAGLLYANENGVFVRMMRRLGNAI